MRSTCAQGSKEALSSCVRSGNPVCLELSLRQGSSVRNTHMYMQTWHEQEVSCKQNELMRSRYCRCAVCKSLSQCGLGQRYTLAAMLTVSYMDDVTEAARCSSFHTAFGPPVQVGLTLAPLALLV